MDLSQNQMLIAGLVVLVLVVLGGLWYMDMLPSLGEKSAEHFSHHSAAGKSVGPSQLMHRLHNSL